MYLLIQSGMIENNIAVKGEEAIVKKQLRILPKKIAAYKIVESEEKNFKMILDTSSGLIESVEIDDISAMINEESEKLDVLEIKYGL